ncbi:MAG TPA: LemA family protein [Symbiobacteriaceae bacterium]|nr:LemA family protein [Symbiobacteriaceae bacterium]
MTAALIVVGVLLLLAVLMYNSLVGKRNQVDSVFSTIDVMLTKRYDLLPNLVTAVKGYMTHERETLEKVTELRTRALGAHSPDEKVAVDNQIAGALRQILVAVENYPELKASENVLQLQASLNEIEEQISAARRAFNAAVLQYNNALDMFPTNLLGSMMGMKHRAFFEVATAEVRQPVRISL